MNEHWFKAQPHDTKTLRAGDRILMPSTAMIAEYLCDHDMTDASAMRRDLARQHDAVITCPVTTRLCLTELAEHANRQREAGTPLEEIVPVWRVLDAKSPVLKRLSFDPAWILEARTLQVRPAIPGRSCPGESFHWCPEKVS